MVRLTGEELRRVLPLVRKVFPRYRGRKVYVTVFRPHVLQTWWDGGSKSDYAEIGPDGVRVTRTWHPLFDGRMVNPPVYHLPQGHILLELSHFHGTETVRIHVHPEDWETWKLPGGGS